nr:cyclin-D5-1-like [Coffea arabica]
MQNSQDAFSSPSSLLCREESENVLNDGGGTIGDYMSNAGKEEEEDDDDDAEYVEMLLREEISGNGPVLQEQECAYISNWIKEARLDAIQYILSTNASFGFKIQTAFLAVTYLDKFLSRRLIEGEKYWAIRLLAIACLSLAAKMEECRVPLLSEFPGEDYNFEGKVIRRMEILILDTLEWRMAIATPYTFTPYFVSKLCKNNQLRDAVSRVIEIIPVAIRNANLIHDRPSTIAAAATLWMLDQRLSRESLELKINALSSSGFLKIEDIISFYNQMKELDTSSSIRSPPLTPIQLRRTSNDVLENSSIASSGLSAKRKSLTFTDEGDQNVKMPDSKRQG